MKSFSLDEFLSVFQSEKLKIYTQTLDDWDYENVEDYLLTCTEFVRQSPSHVLLIFCSHPHCYTLGKGLQKLSSDSSVRLVDFDEEKSLDYPLYQLKRGGGLTFHYPGQMVFYPIINLTSQKLKVHDLMLEILELTKKVLHAKFQFEHLSVNRELLGLWNLNEKKIASMGLAITRFTTYHGLALNFLEDIEIFQSIKRVHPCGLPGEIYTSVESLANKKLTRDDLASFREMFLRDFLHLMIERQISSDSIISEISL